MKFSCCSGGGDFYSNRRRNLIIDYDGAMVVPQYKSVPRIACRLLSLAWEHRWDDVMDRCETTPNEAFAKTEHSGRTALHLVTFNVGCPIRVAAALLKANRHATLVEDRNCYTPLHNLGLFQGGDDLVGLFCDTVIMVEQELQGRGKVPTPSRTSPLYLAAKRDAPASTIRLLLQTRARSLWIAPFTGGESYWDPQQALDKCSSPLEILLRGRSSCFVRISPAAKQKMAAMALQLGTDSWLAASDPTLDPQDRTALDLWAKCLLLLRENVRTMQCAGCTTTTPSLVHTVASLKVPSPALLQIAVGLFPSQVVQHDDTGENPLCHILKSKHPYATQQLIAILLQPPTALGDHPTEDLSPSPLLLLQRERPTYPVEFVQEGLRLGLEIGLSWEGGLKAIVLANSEVLRREDSHTRLVPAFMATAQSANIETIFRLLQAEPSVIRIYGLK